MTKTDNYCLVIMTISVSIFLVLVGFAVLIGILDKHMEIKSEEKEIVQYEE